MRRREFPGLPPDGASPLLLNNAVSLGVNLTLPAPWVPVLSTEKHARPILEDYCRENKMIKCGRVGIFKWLAWGKHRSSWKVRSDAHMQDLGFWKRNLDFFFLPLNRDPKSSGHMSLMLSARAFAALQPGTLLGWINPKTSFLTYPQ